MQVYWEWRQNAEEYAAHEALRQWNNLAPEEQWFVKCLMGFMSYLYHPYNGQIPVSY